MSAAALARRIAEEIEDPRERRRFLKEATGASPSVIRSLAAERIRRLQEADLPPDDDVTVLECKARTYKACQKCRRLLECVMAGEDD